MSVHLLPPAELAGAVAEGTGPLWVDLDASADPAAAEAVERAHRPVLGVTRGGVPEERLLAAMTTSLAVGPTTDRRLVHVDDLQAVTERIDAKVAACPQAAATLVGLLRVTAQLPVHEGVVAESLAYSLLLGGSEFAAWRRSRPVRPTTEQPGDPVLLQRDGDVLTVTLSRPHRHNAFSREVRDGLNEALDVARHDPALRVELRGSGPSFCSGGDLDEFGTARDLVQAHHIRLRESAGLRVHALADRLSAHLHGACIGAGIEVPAFAGTVTATRGTRIQLPELGMGLVPGAGGTVSVTGRIGRWRTAYLVLSGDVIGPETALQWGLVDRVS